MGDRKGVESPPAELQDLEEQSWECDEVEEELMRSAARSYALGIEAAQMLQAQAHERARAAKAQEVAANAHRMGALKALARVRGIDPARIKGAWTDPDGKVVRVRLAPVAEEAKDAAAALGAAFGGES